MCTKNDAAKHWSMLQSSACLVTVPRRHGNKSYSLTITNVQANCFLHNSTAAVQYVIKLSWSCSSWCYSAGKAPPVAGRPLVSTRGYYQYVWAAAALPPRFPLQAQNLLQTQLVLPIRDQLPPTALQPLRGTFLSFAVQRHAPRACKLLHTLASKKQFSSRCFRESGLQQPGQPCRHTQAADFSSTLHTSRL